jgi:vacuolar protein 8
MVFSRRVLVRTPVKREVLEPIFHLLQSPDSEVQRAASAAVGNLAVNGSLFFLLLLFFLSYFVILSLIWPSCSVVDDNKTLIVSMGGLSHLVRLLLSPFSEVQCNACGCLTNLATSPPNKVKIANSGAVPLLVRLANAEDLRVQRNSTGALLNLTHAGFKKHGYLRSHLSRERLTFFFFFSSFWS